MDCGRVITKRSKAVMGREYSLAVIQPVPRTTDFRRFMESMETIVKAVQFSLIIRLTAMFSDIFIVLVVRTSSSIKGAEVTQA
jgi:hypothetical protein